MGKSTNLHDRIWELIDKRGSDDCWHWMGHVDGSTGLGRIMVNWVRYYPHRVVWEEVHGEIPAGRKLVRTCDAPDCCNPKHMALYPTWLERFWANVDRNGPNGCWEWIGRQDRGNGYGVFSLNKLLRYAHRLSYEIANGEIPMVDGKTMFICHHCDNRKCVNPDHLFLGTHTDNMKDCISKGRHGFKIGRGEMNGYVKLTDVQVEEIRRATNMSQRALSRMYGVTQSHIWRIRHNVCRDKGSSYVSRTNGVRAISCA